MTSEQWARVHELEEFMHKAHPTSAFMPRPSQLDDTVVIDVVGPDRSTRMRDLDAAAKFMHVGRPDRQADGRYYLASGHGVTLRTVYGGAR